MKVRDTERKRKSQAESTLSMADPSLDPRTLRSSPEPKPSHWLNPLGHPGTLTENILLEIKPQIQN